jgi:predicted  nucleic acid-binding Zn-ribbon protein
MIGTLSPPARRRPHAAATGEEQATELLTSGSFVGAGSFRCNHCGYTLTLVGSETLSDCPSCGGSDFVRASLFSAAADRLRGRKGDTDTARVMVEAAPPGPDDRLARAREQLEQPGDYLCFEDGGEIKTFALKREWTRIGRSLAADVRFDDPTVSRRHALIVHHADGVRLLDDRSLNGVFVNGARVDGKTLKDGDEIVVGRYRLLFVTVPAEPAGPSEASPGSSSVSAAG